MEMKTFSLFTSISVVITLTIVALSILGILLTGYYSGIIMSFVIAVIPIASKLYATRIISKSNNSERNYYTY